MVKGKGRVITGYPSIFLDCLRIGAALTVLYIHAFDRWFPHFAHNPALPGDPSHAAVVVFFVLSGFVIAHTTISNNRGRRQYAQARLSRLCSVVIPALVITAIIQVIVTCMRPELLHIYTRGPSVIRYILSAFFVNEVWLFSSAPALNGSLWSLSFEFWYYTIFGLWFFRSKGWLGILPVVLACLIAGPKILVMMPVWLAGYFAYRLPRPAISLTASWLIIFALLASMMVLVTVLPAWPYVIHYKPLYYANQFFTDWIIGLIIALALWLLPTKAETAKQQPPALTNKIRFAADLTFPLYVLHFPLIVLWRALFGLNLYDKVQFVELLLAVIIAASLIGIVLEKQRPIWNRFFKWMAGRIAGLFLNKTSSPQTAVKPVNK